MRVDVDNAGIRSILRAPGTAAAMRHLAERAQERAAQISAAEAVDTGRYAASWRVTVFDNGRRVGARIHNTARSPEGTNYPPLLENGWRTRSGRHIPGKHICARSLDAIRL